MTAAENKSKMNIPLSPSDFMLLFKSIFIIIINIARLRTACR